MPDNEHLTNILKMSRDIFDAKMAELKASQGKTGTMFSNEEYQQYIERLKAISQPGYVYSNCFYLKNSYHKSRSSVASITNTALERFLSFMNYFHIFIQIAFIWKTLITKVIVQSLVSHILHWKGFFPSWTTSTWFFKLFYLKFWYWD